MEEAMTEDLRNTIHSHRLLVQRILAGGIPEGRDFDACRAVLSADCHGEEAFEALMYLLQGALADPFFGINETQQLVPILKALSRGEIGVPELM
jgi:hypothetical protein